MTDDRKSPSERPDDVARLIRLAGRRTAVPEVRSARVKAAVREQWLIETRGRRRRRRVWTVASLAAAASIVMAVSIGLMRLGPAPETPSGPIVTVESADGTVWAEPAAGGAGSSGRPLGREDRLEPGDVVATGGDGRLALRLGASASVRVDTDSRVRLVDEDTVSLERGAVYVDSGREGLGMGSLAVRTPLGTIQDVGTQFEVRLGERSVRVRVREGMVILDDGSTRHEVPVATELSLDEDAAATLLPIEIHGPGWAWAEEISAVPPLEGMSASAFLEWVARERGWRLEFASEQLARSADEIRLGGSADRLTLDEALGAVLPTCGMSHSVAGGVLRIEPGTAPGP